MSYEEKGTWILAVSAVVVPVIYFAIVLGQVPNTPVTEIDYIVPMLAAIGVAIAVSIVGISLFAIASPREADKSDERDKQINRLGDSIGYNVLGVLALVPLILAMAEVEHFWIANALYLASILTAVVSSAVKIVAYRRGF